ncbi:MAG: hypothetical protein ACW99G_01455 [Candidatus Thorarchaeota archaeon]|jgi:hypothetical protein
MNVVPKFEEWLKLREGQDGLPASPRGMSKIAMADDKPSGVRCSSHDLSSDYKGHISKNGEVEPFNVKNKKGKKVADVAGGK